jgi:hypothetical protein
MGQRTRANYKQTKNTGCVPVDDALRVQMLERKNHFGQIEPCRLLPHWRMVTLLTQDNSVLCGRVLTHLGERPLVAEIGKKLAARLEIHHEVHLRTYSGEYVSFYFVHVAPVTLESFWKAYDSLVTNGCAIYSSDIAPLS